MTLNGTGSSDADGTIVSYVWTEGATQIATGANPTVALTVGSHSITLTVTDNGGATASHTVVVTVSEAPVLPSGPTSKDHITGERQSSGQALGYYPDSGVSVIGNSNSMGSRSDRNVVMGYSLPTLPAGKTVTSATFRFEITGAGDGQNVNPSLDVYLLNTANPDTSGTSFYYHGNTANTASAKVVGSKYVDVGTSTVLYADDQYDVEFTLTGEALALLQSFYGGDNVPEQPEAFFRFSMNKDPVIGSAFVRYYIDTANDESSLAIHFSGQAPVAAPSELTGAVADSVPLKLASAPTATPNPAQAGGSVSFSVAAIGSESMTYMWDFGDGSSEDGAAVSHTFVAAGEYTVTVMAQDSNGQNTTATLQVTVSEPVDPNDKPQTPTPTPFDILKLSGAVNFKTSGKDACALKGKLPTLDAGFKPQGATVTVDVGGATRTFTLDAKGRARTANGSFSLKKSKTGAITFDAKLTKGTFAALWSDEGADPAKAAKNAPLTMISRITLDGRVYECVSTVLYSAKPGVGAVFKKTK